MSRRWNAGLAPLLGSLMAALAGPLGMAGLQAADIPIAQAGPDGAPAASLDRPLAASNPGRLDRQLQPTSFTTTPLYQTPGPADARPLPVGPPLAQTPGTAAPYSWRPATAQQSGPIMPPADTSSSGTTTLPPPTPMPRADGETSTVVPGTPGYPSMGMPAYPGMPLHSGPVMGVPGAVYADGGIPGGACGDSCCPGVCCPDACCGGTCCDGCCGCMGNCCCQAGNRFYGSVEYLFWWMRGTSLPPLVTSGSIGDTIPGALGQPGTTVLFGGGNTNTSPRSGFRGTAGYWLNDDHTLGVEVGGFFLFNQSSGFAQTSLGAPGSPILTRPFFDVLAGTPSAQLVAAPGVLAGSISVHTDNQLWGAEANVRSNLCCGCNWYFDALLGFRYLALDESVSIQENLTTLVPIPVGSLTVPAGSSLSLTDNFTTHNRFYGTQVGGYGEYRMGQWSLGMKATVALGTTQEMVDISGSTLINVPGSRPRAFPTGFLTERSNIGPHTRDLFGVVPEVGLNLGYQFNDHMRAFVGYNFLYWSSVARAGNQIDTGVNTNQLVPAIGGGPARPAFSFQGSDFWAQGVTLGLEFRY